MTQMLSFGLSLPYGFDMVRSWGSRSLIFAKKRDQEDGLCETRGAVIEPYIKDCLVQIITTRLSLHSIGAWMFRADSGTRRNSILCLNLLLGAQIRGCWPPPVTPRLCCSYLAFFVAESELATSGVLALWREGREA